MREATLYQVTQSTVVVDRDYITIRQYTGCDINDIFTIGTDFAASVSKDVHVPIHRICNVTRSGERQESYIALDPDLQDLLEVPLDIKFREELIQYDSKLTSYETSLAAYERSINEFSSLPWYKRAWRAINNNCF